MQFAPMLRIPTQGELNSGRRNAVGHVTVFLIFLLLSAIYTRPLLSKLTTALPSDAGDPALNASILSWNASTLPFTSAWWDAPHFYPTAGVAALTENLVGFVPFSSPVMWLTGNSIAAYNVAIFLTWPLTALAGYFLVARLTQRRDAAFVAGLALAFNPY